MTKTNSQFDNQYNMYSEKQPPAEFRQMSEIDEKLLESIINEALYRLENIYKNKNRFLPRAINEALDLHKIYHEEAERGEEVDLTKYYKYFETVSEKVIQLRGKQDKTLDIPL